MRRLSRAARIADAARDLRVLIRDHTRPAQVQVPPTMTTVPVPFTVLAPRERDEALRLVCTIFDILNEGDPCR